MFDSFHRKRGDEQTEVKGSKDKSVKMRKKKREEMLGTGEMKRRIGIREKEKKTWKSDKDNTDMSQTKNSRAVNYLLKCVCVYTLHLL